MTGTAIERTEGNALADAIAIDYAAVLRALNLNPASPDVQALVLVCREYDLDPVLGHMVLIDHKPYITHKGLLHIANRNPAFDGMEVVEESETTQEWRARVSVWRKDRSHAFTYRGRYSKSARNKNNGPEMALARAECLALRRAFDVAVPVQEEQDWQASTEVVSADRPAAILAAAEDAPASPPADDGEPLDEEFDRKPIGEVLARLDDEGKALAREAVKGDLPNWQSPQLTKVQALEFQARLGRVEGEMATRYDNRRKMVFAKLGELGFKKDDEPLRHAIVRQATGGRTDSTSALTAAECDTVVAVAEEVAAGGWATSVNDDGEMSLVAVEPEDEGRPFDEEPGQ